MTPEHQAILEHLWACRKAASGEAGSPENTIYLDGYVAGLNQALTRLTPSHVDDMHEWAARQRDTECACEHWVAWECMECDGQCMCHQKSAPEPPETPETEEETPDED